MSASAENEHQLSKEPPSFHDGRLAGFVLSPNRRCSLFLTTEDGEPHRVVLVGVESLRADDFRQGNIILDLTVRSGKSGEKADVLFALSIEDEHRDSEFVASIMERLSRGLLFIVQINPTYGCVLSCLCAGWHVDPNAESDQTADMTALLG